jgi:H+-translocating NAD(P) transhydrogenase subunit alpha
MAFRIAVLGERADGERRVAASPETVRKLIGLGAQLAVERGAGESAAISDDAYVAAGATVSSRADVLAGADLILTVQGADPLSMGEARRGALLLGALDPHGQKARVTAWAAAGVDALAMELVPRITRAQSMDILSSPATRR